MLDSRFQTVTVNLAASDVILKLDFSQKQTKNALPNNVSGRARKVHGYSMPLQTQMGRLNQLVPLPLFFKYHQ